MSERNQEDFLATARKRFTECAADEQPLRDEAAKNLRFVAGDQWNAQLAADRTSAGKPVLTFNRCATFVQQVANEARQNKPQIKYVPSDSGDEDTAEIYEGLARHIQYSSDAQTAYETAVDYSAGGGFGYFRFLTDYCDDQSFDLDLKVVPVVDPFAVYGLLLPAIFRNEPRYAFVTDEMDKGEFETKYPKSEAISLGWEEAGRRSEGWIGAEKIRIAEYWWLEEETETITHPTDKTRTRQVSRKTVKFCKLNGLEVLPDTETEWPGSMIPIVPVLGKQLIVEGKPRLFSVITAQRDPQQLINLYKTRIAETLSVAPISPFIAVDGQLDGHEREWAAMNKTVTPYLLHKGIDKEGRPVPAPQRQSFEPPIASLSNAAAAEIDDMKATSGIYDASLGAQANETSGVAIQRRQQQSNITNLHFMDNLERAFKVGGMIMSEVMPKIYDTAREIRILGEDEAAEIVKINQSHQDEKGKAVHYKIGGDGVGKYDVIVTMGKAFSTKRMESFDMMSSIVQGNAQILPMIGDIFFRNCDMAGSDQLADRFKAMLPPNLQDKDQQIPPQAQAQMAQAHQMIDQLSQHLNQQTHIIETKQVEAANKLAIAKMEIEAKIAIAEIQTKAQNASERQQMYIDIWKELHGSAHDAGMQAVEHAHAANQAQQQQSQQAQDAEQEQASAVQA